VRRRTASALITLGVCALVAMVPMRRVAGDGMAPTIASGDLVWVLPGLTVLQGDVVLLADPLDPDQTILRRAIGPGGTAVVFTDDGVRVDSKRFRLKDMGKLDGYSVHQETLWSKPPARSVDWLTRRVREPSVRWAAQAVEVPQGHWYLLADDRDQAIDSRWWGPIPESEILGVVRLRYGPANTWRSQLAVVRGTE
jgi:signal peptidase I